MLGRGIFGIGERDGVQKPVCHDDDLALAAKLLAGGHAVGDGCAEALDGLGTGPGRLEHQRTPIAHDPAAPAIRQVQHVGMVIDRHPHPSGAFRYCASQKVGFHGHIVEVVEEQRTRKQDAEAIRSKLALALKQLEAA